MDDASAIRLVVDLYGLGVDSQQWDLFDEVFTPDVHAEYGGGTKVFRDLASLKEDFAAFHAPFDATQHAMANMIHEVEGEVAHALTYGIWLLVKRGTPGGDVFRANGWYDDELVRGGRGWLIRRRRVRVVHMEGNLALLTGGSPTAPKAPLGMAQQASDIPLLAARRRRLAG